MDFSRRKLTVDTAGDLRLCPIETVQAYAPMLCPVYVLMKMNEKFVSVKEPLDFFTPAELERLRSFETFFLPQFIESVRPFQDAGRAVRGILEWTPNAENTMPPAEYELSDAVLRVVGSLWGNDAVIEPFFVSAFAGELCDLLPEAYLVAARDADVDRYEKAVFVSSWVVFLALHLGYSDRALVSRMRRRVFAGETGVADAQDKGTPAPGSELADLVQLARDSLKASGFKVLKGEFFASRKDRVSQRIAARLERVRREFIQKDGEIPSIFGKKGFVDV